uniref:Uncharacterized protein n=1 Tax=Tetranychus urticae TaxID=32264 RepID=T1K7B4_TETUR
MLLLVNCIQEFTISKNDPNNNNITHST